MTWKKTRADRQADARNYGPDYRRNREIARRRANGVCEGCHHRHAKLECDHIIPRSQGGSHHPDNLRMLCKGPGTCQCHEQKTAQEGGGYRQRGRGSTQDPAPRPRTVW